MSRIANSSSNKKSLPPAARRLRPLRLLLGKSRSNSTAVSCCWCLLLLVLLMPSDETMNRLLQRIPASLTARSSLGGGGRRAAAGNGVGVRVQAYCYYTTTRRPILLTPPARRTITIITSRSLGEEKDEGNSIGKNIHLGGGGGGGGGRQQQKPPGAPAFLPSPAFKPGDAICVEVTSFGPMGASVDVIGQGHDPDNSDKIIGVDEPPLATGLILQKEIRYFRERRDGVDVVRGEVLPAFVERVRDDGKVNVGLRTFGGKAKAMEVAEMIVDRLEVLGVGGSLPVGDKSSPADVSRLFPGVSKSAFKRGLSSLYKKGLVKPSPNSITLMEQPPNDK